jgi:hypothetical protein
MTALNGYVHDKWGAGWMLLTEAIAAIVCVVLGLLVLRMIQNRSGDLRP